MLKTLLRVRLAAFAAYFTGASRSQKKRSGAQKIGMLLLMLYCFAAFGMLFYTSFSSLAGVYAKLSLGWLYFAMYAVAAFALMVFGTVFTAKAQLFEAKDNELLLSLPVRPRDILASRMVSLLLWNLLFGLMVAVPALLAWTQAARLPALGFVSFILLLPALACFSLAVTSLLAWALSLLGSRVRNKSLAAIIGSVVFLGLYFAVIFRMNSYITQLAQNGAQIAAALSGAKVLVWLGRAMAGENAPALVWSLLVTLAPFGLVSWLLGRSFTRIVTTKRGLPKVRYEEKTLRTASADTALLHRELRRLGASPTYLLNSGLGVLFLLAAAVVLVIKRDVILDVLAQMPELASSLPVFLALAIGGMLGMTLFTPSSVSLEGKNLWILQSMPVSGAQVLRAKLRMADLLTLPAAVIASVCCVCVTELSPLCKRAWFARGHCARKARLVERSAGRKAELGRDADDARLLGRFARGRRGLADVAGRACIPGGIFAGLRRGAALFGHAPSSLAANRWGRTVFASWLIGNSKEAPEVSAFCRLVNPRPLRYDRRC